MAQLPMDSCWGNAHAQCHVLEVLLIDDAFDDDDLIPCVL